jgi:hypothetical protein
MSPGRSAEANSATPLIDPYATTVAQLSMAPATTTTVITTTTTTTTQFPPMLLKQPLSLGERDPKEYPLAHTPAPESIRRVMFNVDGEQVLFEEADVGVEAIKEVCTIHFRNFILAILRRKLYPAQKTDTNSYFSTVTFKISSRPPTGNSNLSKHSKASPRSPHQAACHDQPP